MGPAIWINRTKQTDIIWHFTICHFLKRAQCSPYDFINALLFFIIHPQKRRFINNFILAAFLGENDIKNVQQLSASKVPAWKIQHQLTFVLVMCFRSWNTRGLLTLKTQKCNASCWLMKSFAGNCKILCTPISWKYLARLVIFPRFVFAFFCC